MSEKNEPICAVCRGAKSEHGSQTKHAFTETDGDLKTVSQDRAEKLQQMGPQMRLQGAQTNEATAIARLLEVLMRKGILTLPESFYVATGVKADEAQVQMFSDPSKLAFGGQQ